MNKLLIVEDNDEYREFLVNEFEKGGYYVDEANSPIKGLEAVALTKYDAIITDLNLPVMNGIMFTESVMNISPNSVCIILTGDPDEYSEIQSIKNNIDLYIEKNKPISVIMSYVDDLIEKNQENVKSLVLYSNNEDIVMSVREHHVTKNGELLDLTPKEYEILKLFLSNKNKVLSREHIVEFAWQEPAESVDTRLVDAHVKKLRDKLKSISIMTVRGYGYRWNEVE